MFSVGVRRNGAETYLRLSNIRAKHVRKTKQSNYNTFAGQIGNINI